MICDRCGGELTDVPNFFPMCSNCGEAALSAESVLAIRRVFQAYERLQDDGREERGPRWVQ